MSNSTRSAFVVLLSFLATAELQPQAIGAVRIRRYATDSIVAQGALIGRAGEQLLLKVGDQRTTWPLSPDIVTERYGKKGHAVRGALVGLIAGFAISLAIYPPDTSKAPMGCWFGGSCDPYDPGGSTAASSAAFLLGPIVGAFIGSRIKTGRGWSGFDPWDLPEGGPELGLILAPSKLGVSIRVPLPLVAQ